MEFVANDGFDSPVDCIMDGGRGSSFGMNIDGSTSACCVVVVCNWDRKGNCIEGFCRRCVLAFAKPRAFCDCIFLPYVLMNDDGRDNVFDGMESKMHRTTRPQIRHISKSQAVPGERPE